MSIVQCLTSPHFRQQNVAASADHAFDTIAANESARSAAAAEIPYKIPTGDDTESLIGQALLTGRREAAVELCLADGRYADAIIIAMTGGSELLARTQCRYLQRQRGYLANIISALVTDDWSGVVAQCTTDSWREALAATLTHATDQMPALCEQLGERLQTEALDGGERTALESAILCYICAGNVEKLVESWQKDGAEVDIADLQELVEIVMVLQKALELQGRHSTGASGRLADLLTRYAGLLAAQGALGSALAYLGPSVDPQVVDLRERLYYSLGHKQAYATAARSQHNQQPQQQQLSQPQSRFAPQQPQQPQQRASFASQGPLVYPGAAVPQANQWNTAPMQSAPVQPAWNAPMIPAAVPVGLPPNGAAPPSGLGQPARPPSAHGKTTFSFSQFFF